MGQKRYSEVYEFDKNYKIKYYLIYFGITSQKDKIKLLLAQNFAKFMFFDFYQIICNVTLFDKIDLVPLAGFNYQHHCHISVKLCH